MFDKVLIINDFNDLTEPMLDFLNNAEKDNIFNGKTWYQNYIENIIKPDSEVYFFVATENEGANIVAIIPCYYNSEEQQLSSLSNYYTSLYSPVVDIENPAWNDAIDAIVKAIKNHKPSWSCLNFRPLSATDVTTGVLKEALSRHGFWVQKYFAFGNWIYNLKNQGFSDYYEERPSKLKNTIKRKNKKLAKDHDYSIAIYIDSKDAVNAIEDYEKIYLSSWKQEEPYPDFVRGLIRKYSATQQLRFGFLYINKRAVAAQIWFVVEGIAYIFKLAYDPEYRQYSAGSILTKALMEHVIEQDKVHTIDYLTGDDAYKRDWMNLRRERVGIIAYNPATLKGFKDGAYNILGQKLKAVLKKVKK